jgi:hypothetical protein
MLLVVLVTRHWSLDVPALTSAAASTRPEIVGQPLLFGLGMLSGLMLVVASAAFAQRAEHRRDAFAARLAAGRPWAPWRA